MCGIELLNVKVSDTTGDEQNYLKLVSENLFCNIPVTPTVKGRQK